ncbi:histidinol dehydrogenase [bacterium]|jgi:histidinol dehydrogenase|nr:histidinol dehydrogenase [bacterium]
MLSISEDYKKVIKELHSSNSGNSEEVKQTLTTIQNEVKLHGDVAIQAFSKKFDNVNVEYDLKVSEEELRNAFYHVPDSFVVALKKAIKNITLFHKPQLPHFLPKDLTNYLATATTDIKQSIRYLPIDSAGLYVPGGRAPLPSTILMNAIPAKVAGVEKLIMTTPPQPNGKISPQTLVAAKCCGISDIFKVGGAQAVFGMAYGTDTIPKVDKIVGPGNIYVTGAKKMVFGEVGIDKLAGPSEVQVFIDNIKYAKYAALEMIAQLEHDPLAIAMAVSTEKETLVAINDAITTYLPTCKRQDILTQSIKNGKLILAKSIEECMTITNEFAPEHLVLLSDTPEKYLNDIRHAGSIFMGPYTPVTLGDFYAGPNHVLPTSGTSRFASPLGVMDFMKFSSVLQYSKEALKKAEKDLTILTEMEGLDAHFKCVSERLAD